MALDIKALSKIYTFASLITSITEIPAYVAVAQHLVEGFWTLLNAPFVQSTLYHLPFCHKEDHPSEEKTMISTHMLE
jgi:hypothetical protein